MMMEPSLLLPRGSGKPYAVRTTSGSERPTLTWSYNDQLSEPRSDGENPDYEPSSRSVDTVTQVCHEFQFRSCSTLIFRIFFGLCPPSKLLMSMPSGWIIL